MFLVKKKSRMIDSVLYFAAEPCENLTAPTNGALVCNGWNTEFTRVCVVFCTKGKHISSGHDIRTKYVCGGSGKWLPAYPEKPPSCQPGKRTYTTQAFQALGFPACMSLIKHCFIFAMK
jgi:hypothetical protein